MRNLPKNRLEHQATMLQNPAQMVDMEQSLATWCGMHEASTILAKACLI